MHSSSSSSSNKIPRLTSTTWGSFKTEFKTHVQRQKGSVAIFMVTGVYPSSHSLCATCIYMVDPKDKGAIQVGSATETFTDINGKVLKHCHVGSQENLREVLKFTVKFAEDCIIIAAELVSACDKAVIELLELIPEWNNWVITGRIDMMWARLEKTFLTDSTVITTQVSMSLHMCRLMKEYMFNLQGSKPLATFIKEQQTTIDSMVNAGLTKATYEQLFGFTFIQNLNPDFTDSIRRAELDKKLDPDTMSFAVAQKWAREWQSERNSLDSALLNHGNPTSSTNNNITANLTTVGTSNKKGKTHKNKNTRNNHSSTSDNKDKPPKKPHCRLCGYDKGHTTEQCEAIKTMSVGEIKQLLIRTESEAAKFSKERRASKNNNSNNSKTA